MGHTACGQQIQSNTSKVGYAAGGQFLSSRYSSLRCEIHELNLGQSVALWMMPVVHVLNRRTCISKL